MGCGLCTPRAHHYKSSAVSPTAQAVGKKASLADAAPSQQDAQHALPSTRSRPESWRARCEEAKPEAPADRSEGPRAAAEAEAFGSEAPALPGVLVQPAAEVAVAKMPSEAQEGPLVLEGPSTAKRHEATRPRPEEAEPAEAPSVGLDWEMEATLPALAAQLRRGEAAATSSARRKKAAVAPESSWQVEEAEAQPSLPAPPISPAAQASPAWQTSTSEASLHLPISHETGSSQTSKSTWKLEEADIFSPLAHAIETEKAADDNSPLSEPMVQTLPKAPAFPSDVEVSTSTQLMLLTWARWGRNAWRIKQEDQIKQLQHRRFPRTPAPPREPLSPQPTPRSTPRESPETETPGSSPGSSPASSSRPRTGAAAWRAGGELGMGTTVHSREGREVREGRDDRGFAFAELREEQRDSMAQQGARTKLVRALGGSAATAHSTGTPGFGVDTPGFPGASGAASADASVVSSGVASPVKGGQMSPWILEAEALCEETDEDVSPGGGGGWSLDPGSDNLLLSIEEELRQPRKEKVEEPPQPTEPAVQANDDQVLDEDELQRVEMFEESPSKKSAQEQSSPAHDAARAAEEKLPAKDDSAHQPFEYMVGEKVSYYSSSHGAWMPARIVERKSRTIYVIDKQMRGCMAKVRASELVSEREEEKNPVLRAFDVLEVRAPSNRPTRPTSATRSGSSPKGRSGSPPAAPTRVPGNRGRVVRDDFSDDSDDG
ncbi:FEN1 [Symbiodinium microadriaticum]|nr:FEN1 [Symbiodinium microadriaticum]